MKMILSLLAMILTGLVVLPGAYAGNDTRETRTMNTEHTRLEKAIFAGGCFWCMEPPFERLAGVREVIAGYTGGTSTAPEYDDYAEEGHMEAVEIIYDPARVSYDQLLEVFWRQIDPTDPDGQFADRGQEYRSAIFFLTPEQKEKAETSKKEMEERGVFDRPIVTSILPAATFYRAEDYHQDYYMRNSLRYKFYRNGSGRDQFLDKVWGKARKPYGVRELQRRLTPLQYKVTQEEGTEPAFNNEYWDNQEPGIYVDIVSGEPLFGSPDKYKSGTGWPSFTRPLVPENIVTRPDRTMFFAVRTEVRSKYAGSHLGHVFDDGPPPTGQRYCLNSAALRFVPVRDLEKEGYGEFLPLFKK